MAHSSTKRRLRSEIRSFENLKENVKEIVANLNSSVSCMDDSVDDVNDEYTIDNECAVITSSIINLRNDVSKTSNYLNNRVLPEIRDRIHHLEHELRKLEEEDD